MQPISGFDAHLLGARDVYKMINTKYEVYPTPELGYLAQKKDDTSRNHENLHLNTFLMIFIENLLKDPGFFGNFRNLSNFGELYLRAQ